MVMGGDQYGLELCDKNQLSAALAFIMARVRAGVYCRTLLIDTPERGHFL